MDWYLAQYTLGQRDHFWKISFVIEQEGHDGPVSLHRLLRKIHSYQTLQYFGIGLKRKTPKKDQNW